MEVFGVLILEGLKIDKTVDSIRLAFTFRQNSILDEYFSKTIRQTEISFTFSYNPLLIPLFYLYNPSFSLGKYKQFEIE